MKTMRDTAIGEIYVALLKDGGRVISCRKKEFKDSGEKFKDSREKFKDHWVITVRYWHPGWIRRGDKIFHLSYNTSWWISSD